MPFSIKLSLGAEHPIIFEGWLEDVFGKYVRKGTAFAKASSPTGPGYIVTNGPMFLSSGAPLVLGSRMVPGEFIAAGAANGEDIPYGKPYCVFVPKYDLLAKPISGQSCRRNLRPRQATRSVLDCCRNTGFTLVGPLEVLGGAWRCGTDCADNADKAKIVCGSGCTCLRGQATRRLNPDGCQSPWLGGSFSCCSSFFWPLWFSSPMPRTACSVTTGSGCWEAPRLCFACTWSVSGAVS